MFVKTLNMHLELGLNKMQIVADKNFKYLNSKNFFKIKAKSLTFF